MPGPTRVVARIDVEHLPGLDRLQPQAAGQLHRRIEIRHRHADIGGRPCSCASAWRMSGRRRASSDGRPTGTRGGTGGTGFATDQLGLQRVRRLAQQQADGIDQLRLLLFEWRDLRRSRCAIAQPRSQRRGQWSRRRLRAAGSAAGSAARLSSCPGRSATSAAPRAAGCSRARPRRGRAAAHCAAPLPRPTTEAVAEFHANAAPGPTGRLPRRRRTRPDRHRMH